MNYTTKEIFEKCTFIIVEENNENKPLEIKYAQNVKKLCFK
jgi:hypothetical protein